MLALLKIDINAIDLCKPKETKSRISETHSHVRELIIHGKTFTGYSAVEQIVTFCPDLHLLSFNRKGCYRNVILHANLTLKDFHSAVLDIPSHGSSVLRQLYQSRPKRDRVL
jgi:hypothetical protein